MKLKDLGLESVDNVKREVLNEYEGKVKILNVTNPENIIRRANQLGIDPSEVFVRVTVSDGEDNIVLSNKLKFIGEKDYQELIDAKDTGKELLIHVTTYESSNESRDGQPDAFFYVVHSMTAKDLFAKVNTSKDTKTSDTTAEEVIKRIKNRK
jgi:hypothetical protein